VPEGVPPTLAKGLGFALACLLVWLAAVANADVIYQYTGNLFTTPPSPYTMGDFVSGTIQLSAALPANETSLDLLAVNTPITLDGYSFSDGVGNLTFANAIASFAMLSTNGSGVITAWNFKYHGIGHDMTTNNVGPGTGQDLGDILYAQASVFDNPGTWTLVPEPSALLLVATGVVGIAVRRHPARGASLGERASR